MSKVIFSLRFCFVMLLFCPGLLLAQPKNEKDYHNEEKGMVTLSIGPSVPLADYGNKDINDPSSGLAKTGLNYQANFSYLLGSNLGIAVKGFYFYNPQDPNEWLNNFLRGAAPSQFFKVTTNPWEIKGFSGGLYSTFEIEENYADLRILIGYANVKFPNVLIELQEGLQKASLFIDAKSKNVPVFEIGVGLRIPMVEKFDALIDFDFLNTEVQFDVFDDSANFLYTQTSRVSVSNISLGCAYKF